MRGRGRPAKPAEDLTVSTHVRLSPADRATLDQLQTIARRQEGRPVSQAEILGRGLRLLAREVTPCE